MSLSPRRQAAAPLDDIREAEAFARRRLVVGPTLATPALQVWRAYAGPLSAPALLSALAYVPGVSVGESRSGRAWVVGACVRSPCSGPGSQRGHSDPLVSTSTGTS